MNAHTALGSEEIRGGGDFDSPLPQESFHAIHLASDNFSSFVRCIDLITIIFHIIDLLHRF